MTRIPSSQRSSTMIACRSTSGGFRGLHNSHPTPNGIRLSHRTPNGILLNPRAPSTPSCTTSRDPNRSNSLTPLLTKRPRTPTLSSLLPPATQPLPLPHVNHPPLEGCQSRLKPLGVLHGKQLPLNKLHSGGNHSERYLSPQLHQSSLRRL